MSTHNICFHGEITKNILCIYHFFTCYSAWSRLRTEQFNAGIVNEWIANGNLGVTGI